jgi:tetratricopeptide (TPR) repeat protein
MILSSALRSVVLGLGSLVILACAAAGPGEADWPPLAKKWFDRGDQSFRNGDVEDAQEAADNALRIDPDRPEIRLLAGRVALANLEYDRALQILKGVEGVEARALRGRAYWYAGRFAIPGPPRSRSLPAGARAARRSRSAAGCWRFRTCRASARRR